MDNLNVNFGDLPKVVSFKDRYSAPLLGKNSDKRKKKRVNVVHLLEQRPTLALSVRYRDLLPPLLFPVRRLSQDFYSDDEDEGQSGWSGLV